VRLLCEPTRRIKIHKSFILSKFIHLVGIFRLIEAFKVMQTYKLPRTWKVLAVTEWNGAWYRTKQRQLIVLILCTHPGLKSGGNLVTRPWRPCPRLLAFASSCYFLVQCIFAISLPPFKLLPSIWRKTLMLHKQYQAHARRCQIQTPKLNFRITFGLPEQILVSQEKQLSEIENLAKLSTKIKVHLNV